ncbi:hypothetical protein BBJ28_00018683 [Nothophytophthora sp. Chile5]|nr:hypothetical protein BBJ28_00018683 [Nothophytophthora sp. Chile5]
MGNKRWIGEEEYGRQSVEQCMKGVKSKLYAYASATLKTKTATQVESKCIELEASYKEYKTKLNRSGLGLKETDPSSIKGVSDTPLPPGNGLSAENADNEPIADDALSKPASTTGAKRALEGLRNPPPVVRMLEGLREDRERERAKRHKVKMDLREEEVQLKRQQFDLLKEELRLKEKKMDRQFKLMGQQIALQAKQLELEVSKRA